jgi:hypothetical protein
MQISWASRKVPTSDTVAHSGRRPHPRLHFPAQISNTPPMIEKRWLRVGCLTRHLCFMRANGPWCSRKLHTVYLHKNRGIPVIVPRIVHIALRAARPKFSIVVCHTRRWLAKLILLQRESGLTVCHGEVKKEEVNSLTLGTSSIVRSLISHRVCTETTGSRSPERAAQNDSKLCMRVSSACAITPSLTVGHFRQSSAPCQLVATLGDLKHLSQNPPTPSCSDAS